MHQIELEIQNEELRRAQAELEASRTRYFDLYDQAPIGYCALSEKELILEVNLAAATLLGVARSALVNRALTSFVHPEDQDIYYLHRKKLLETGAPQTCELRMLRADAGHFWAQVEATAAKNSAGAAVRRVVMSDITERRRAEETLRESEERYRLLIDTANESIVVAQDGLLKFVNPVTLGLLEGYLEQEIIDRPFTEFIHPDDRSMVVDNFRRRIAGEPVQSRYAFRLATRVGTIKSVEISVALIEWQGRPATLNFLTDITKRKQAEQERQSAREFLDRIINAIADPVFVKDDKRRFVLVNDALCAIVGRPREGLLGEDGDDIFPDDQVAVFRKMDTRVLDTGDENVNEESLSNLSSGEVRTIVTRKTRYIDPSGKRFLVGVIRDFTERKKTEEALRASEQRFRTAAESLMDVIYEWDIKEKVDWHGDIDSMMGYPPGEFPRTIGAWAATIHPEDKDRVVAALEDHVKGLAPYIVEYRVGRRDGEWRWWSARGVALRDDRGEPHKMIGSVTDITERKRAEAEVGMAAVYLDTMPDALCVTTTDSSIIRVNKAFSELWGYSSEEVIGRSIFDFLPNEERRKNRDEIEEAMITGAIRQFESQILTKDGNIVPVAVSGTVLRDEGGHIAALIAVIRDTTERKRVEEALEHSQAQFHQAQKMESVGRLAGGVAHDFNNQLQVIFSCTTLAQEHVDPSEPLYADLEEIRKAAQHSAALTRQLLAFARKQTIAPEVVDLNVTIESMLKMLRRLIGEDIDLAWLPGRNLWQVKVDPAQIDQLLANLCVNAWDAIGGVGKITIETGTAELDEVSCAEQAGCVPGEYVLLAVSDDGCGMDKETLGRLFEPFYTTKGVGKGTGLGLATVHGIVTQNKGLVSVQSEPGKGTTFRIYLPRHVGEAVDARKERTEEVPRGHGETVLVVEDELSILRLARRMLESLGYTVLTAGTPGEARRLAEQHGGEIHLLITDLVMPEMTGKDLVERIIGARPRLRCLYMSGYTADVIAPFGVLEAEVRLLQKPFALHDLAVKVREALEG
ncbi:MAG: PAS domain S-box protein [Anaerolineae bacterium]